MVSVIIAAHNEEETITTRLENVVEQNYPDDRLEIVLVSDGSTDNTLARAEQWLQGRDSDTPAVHLLAHKYARGKPAALNAGVETATGDLLVFADCRQRFSPTAVTELVGCFAAPNVGAASGELLFTRDETSEIAQEMGLYWRYEKLVRRLESETGSMIGVTGAIYAMRRSLYRPLPEEVLLDDVLQPMYVILQGYRVVFQSRAKAYDTVSKNLQGEWRRKVRTLAGNWQLISLAPELFVPWKNPALWRFLSHKIMRLLVPLWLVLALVTCLLADSVWYRVLGYGQLVCYLLAILGGPGMVAARFKVARFFHFFCVLNIAVVVGGWIWMTGKTRTIWKSPPEKGKREGGVKGVASTGKALLLGDYPPPYGGISAHVETVVERLEIDEGIATMVIDTDVGASAKGQRVISSGSRLALVFNIFTGSRGHDLVHLHTNGHNNGSWLLLCITILMARLSGVPSLVTLHSGNAADYIEDLMGIRRQVFLRMLSMADAVIAVNNRLYDCLADRLPEKEKLHHLPAYVGLRCPPAENLTADLATFFAAHSPVFSSIVAFREEYGLAALLDFCRLWRQRQPQTGLVVVGSGGEYATFAQMIREYGLESTVKVVQDVQPDMVYAVLRQSAAFLRLTRFDGDAVSVREALSLGVPVLATATDFRPLGVTTFEVGDINTLMRLSSQVVTGKSGVNTRLHPAGEEYFQPLVELYRRVLSDKRTSR